VHDLDRHHRHAAPRDGAEQGKLDASEDVSALGGEHGGWPMFHGGAFNMSASVKAYCALKAIGDAPDAPHMARARHAPPWNMGHPPCSPCLRRRYAPILACRAGVMRSM
jgi:hypothetical protein